MWSSRKWEVIFDKRDLCDWHRRQLPPHNITSSLYIVCKGFPPIDEYFLDGGVEVGANADRVNDNNQSPSGCICDNHVLMPMNGHVWSQTAIAHRSKVITVCAIQCASRKKVLFKQNPILSLKFKRDRSRARFGLKIFLDGTKWFLLKFQSQH